MRLNSVVTGVFFLSLILTLNLCVSFAEDKAPFTGEINANNINLRSDATTSAPVIGVLNKGEQVEVVADLYEWYKIRLPKNIPVYIKKSLASCIDYKNPQSSPALRTCASIKVLNDRVNIRNKASEASAILGIADKNEIISVLDEETNWYRIEPIQNSFGWVHKKFVGAAKLGLSKSVPAAIQEDNIVLRGIVKPYGVIFKRKATHKLITADRKVYLLKGNRSALDALNHRQVKVIGKIISPKESNLCVVDVKIIEVAN